MLSDKMQDMLNAQINKEFYAAYLYLAMAAHFESTDFRGFARWMRVQAEEELGHAMKIYDYVHECDGRVTLTEIKAPTPTWESPLAAFQAAHAHEKAVTDSINALVNQAISEGDHATHSFLQWFVDEQVEELAITLAVVRDLERVGGNMQGLFMLDRELGRRESD